jgi:hypothetical protein
VVVAAGGKGGEEEESNLDLRRRDRQAEKRRPGRGRVFTRSAFIHAGIEIDDADLLDQ